MSPYASGAQKFPVVCCSYVPINVKPQAPKLRKRVGQVSLARNLLPNGTNTVSRYETLSLHTTVSSCCGQGLGSDPNGAPT